MKPDWDKLAAEFKDHATIGVYDVDCTAGGKSLCDANGVKGYPTIKTGDPSDLQDYQGGRDLASLQKHARGLKPSCSPTNINLCDAEQKAEIEAVQAKSDDELDAIIKKGKEDGEAAEAEFKAEVDKLQKAYQGLMSAKDEKLAAIKESGLGLAKAVKAARAKAAKSAGKDEL